MSPHVCAGDSAEQSVKDSALELQNRGCCCNKYQSMPGGVQPPHITRQPLEAIAGRSGGFFVFSAALQRQELVPKAEEP